MSRSYFNTESSMSGVAGYSPLLKKSDGSNDIIERKINQPIDIEDFIENDNIENTNEMMLLAINNYNSLNEKDDLSDLDDISGDVVSAKKQGNGAISKLVNRMKTIGKGLQVEKTPDKLRFRKVKKFIRICIYILIIFGTAHFLPIGGICLKAILILVEMCKMKSIENNKLQDSVDFLDDQQKYIKEKMEQADNPEEKNELRKMLRKLEQSNRDILHILERQKKKKNEY